MINHSLVDFYAPYLTGGDLCFDIGAWTGDYAMAMLEHGCFVVGVEPQPDICESLRLRFARWITAHRMYVVEKACAMQAGIATLYPAAHSSMATMSGLFRRISMANGDPWPNRNYSVETVTLDYLIDMFGTPHYIKIDVEGYDAEVLHGLCRPVNLISFEYNTQSGLVEIARDCVEQIGLLGAYTFNYVRHGDKNFYLHDFVDDAGILEMLAAEHKSGKYWFGDIFARRVK